MSRWLAWVAWGSAVVAVVALASCRKPVTGSFDRPFELHVRQAARFPKSDLDLYFRRVAADSRCPQGAQCITAGDAVVTMEGRILKAPPETFDLLLPGGVSATDSLPWKAYDGYQIRLLRLEPAPVVGRSPDTTAYVATLLVEKR